MDLSCFPAQAVEVYVAETKKSSKAASVFGALLQKVELAAAPGIVAVACLPSEGAEVQMALGELGGKPVQIPNIGGTPASASRCVSSRSRPFWSSSAKEDGIHTAPTQLAVSGQAFALDAWVPTEKAGAVKAALKEYASHMEVEALLDDHHHHDDDHDDDHGHHEPTPPCLGERQRLPSVRIARRPCWPPSLRHL